MPRHALTRGADVGEQNALLLHEVEGDAQVVQAVHLQRPNRQQDTPRTRIPLHCNDARGPWRPPSESAAAAACKQAHGATPQEAAEQAESVEWLKEGRYRQRGLGVPLGQFGVRQQLQQIAQNHTVCQTAQTSADQSNYTSASNAYRRDRDQSP